MGSMNPTSLVSNALTGLNSALSVAIPLIRTGSALFSDIQSFGDDPYKDERQRLQKQQQLALKQLRASQDEKLLDLQEQSALAAEKSVTDSAAAEQTRLSALRRAVARQRAAYGVSGLSSTGGSAEAVLLGLFEESDDERETRARLDDIRNRTLEQNLDAQKRLNVLQVSQLKQKQRLERELLGY